MKRFDKLDDGRYLGFEDGCVLQGLQPGEKYSGSYEKLVKSITTFVSAEHQQRARQQLFTSLTVSWAVQNGDAHLKNFGILYDRPSGARYLAPAFDIVSTTPYLSQDTPALTLAGKKAWGNLRFLEEFGRVRCGLSMSAVATIFTRVAQALEQVTVDMDSYIQDKPAFKGVGAKMQETFSSSQRLFSTHLAKPG
jgi:serine/threonine-protein kinase HipA